jgi:hypothetical protein
MKTFIAVLTVIFVSAGSSQARMTLTSALRPPHFPTCSDGLARRVCLCRRAGDTSWHHPPLCLSGWYCHTFDGVCRQ